MSRAFCISRGVRPSGAVHSCESFLFLFVPVLQAQVHTGPFKEILVLNFELIVGPIHLYGG
jgi:hypothetical protein